MNDIRGLLDCTGRCLVFSLAILALGCAQDGGVRDSAGTTSGSTMEPTSVSQSEDARFTTVEEQGAKIWKPSGPGRVDSTSNTLTINAKNRDAKPLRLKVINSLSADHGFAIDSMNVKEVLKPGEERTITVAQESIDPSFTRHRVYCQLHEQHVPATLIINRDPSSTAESGSPSDVSRPSQSRQSERPSDSSRPPQTRQDERPSDSGLPAQSRQDTGMTEGQRMISEQSEHQRQIESTSRGDKAPSSTDPKECEGFPGFDRGCPGGPK